MTYRIRETLEAIKDVTGLATYMLSELENEKAAMDFLDKYDRKIEALKTFPFGYKGISFEYRGLEIRLKPFETYNIFFAVNTLPREIIILRVLKDRQDWKSIFDK